MGSKNWNKNLKPKCKFYIFFQIYSYKLKTRVLEKMTKSRVPGHLILDEEITNRVWIRDLDKQNFTEL